MTRVDRCYCDAWSYTAHRGTAQASRVGAATDDSGCRVVPDIEEERMLRALLLEGAALASRGPFVACFHGWCIRVSCNGRCGADCAAPLTAEIRCRHGQLLERTCLSARYRINEAAERSQDGGQ